MTWWPGICVLPSSSSILIQEETTRTREKPQCHPTEMECVTEDVTEGQLRCFSTCKSLLLLKFSYFVHYVPCIQPVCAGEQPQSLQGQVSQIFSCAVIVVLCKPHIKASARVPNIYLVTGQWNQINYSFCASDIGVSVLDWAEIFFVFPHWPFCTALTIAEVSKTPQRRQPFYLSFADCGKLCMYKAWPPSCLYSFYHCMWLRLLFSQLFQ